METQASNRNPAPEFGTYINYETVFRQKARDGDIEQFLSGIPLDHALQFFGGLGLLVANFEGEGFFDFQKGVVRELGVGLPYASRISEQLVPQKTFVNPEQVAVLQKLSMLHCKPEGTSLPADFGDRLLRVMLAYNSSRGLEDVDRSDTKKAMLVVELRNMFGSREHVGFLIDLYWRFFKWASTDEAKTNTHYLDANADFASFYGLTYAEYAAIAFMFLSHFQRIRSVADLDAYALFLDVDAAFKDLTTQEPIRRWLNQNSISLSDATRRFQESPSPRYAGFSLKPLLERPLVRVLPNIVYPPHLPYLENKMGAGLFFALLDGYNEADGDRKRSKRFTQFFADFFEQRCVELAKQAHPTPQDVFGEQRYGGGSKSTDLVIFEGENAVFVDIATARLTMKDTLIELDAKSLAKDIEKIVGNAKQMTGAIAAFKSGTLVYRDESGSPIDPTTIKRIYPVALIIAPIPRFFAVNLMIFDAIKTNGYLPGCEQFEVLSAEEFDLLMRLCRSGCLISEVLARKLGQATPWKRMSAFKNYLTLYDHELLDRARSVQWATLEDAWTDEILAVTRSWGMR